MSPSSQIGPRERQILTAIVETYIATGEPVGSRVLSRTNKDGLSAATIRNVMADLSEVGYLDQPHTSAGRIPTPEAYRYYVEQISGRAQVSTADQAKIAGSFAGVGDVQEFLERTSHVLSLISSGVGVAVSTSGKKNALDHIHFTRLSNQKALAVLFTTAGAEDKEKLQQMLRTLEERQKVAEFPSGYLDAQQEAVRVVIGLEDTVPEMKNFVLIGAPARVGSEVRGSLAVIGPTRMDYEHT